MLTNTLGDVMLSVDELVHDGEGILFAIAPVFFFNDAIYFLASVESRIAPKIPSVMAPFIILRDIRLERSQVVVFFL
jgi:cellulose synthase/poly-beta-1,6-N-acetylglucosamine synthase-like glycosyltransferase